MYIPCLILIFKFLIEKQPIEVAHTTMEHPVDLPLLRMFLEVDKDYQKHCFKFQKLKILMVALDRFDSN